MSAILYGAIFAAAANAANITTSIWLPGAANADATFVGSVIEHSGDSTVLSLAFADAAITPDLFRSAPQQVTIGGTTYVAYNVSANDGGASLAPADAFSITIELECRRSSGGISAMPTCTLSTLGAGDMFGDICAGMTSQYYINNFPLIITAGTEKLGASAAATPNAGSVSVTTGSTSLTSASLSILSPSAQQATGGAAPMKTMAPALAGLGAAVGAFFL
ncbi:hypothetical protein SNOG_01853 [Parastagonospora nodorum SN15]|uniref:ML-like domain-containing protein n=1 Tax=Phaeosphaeria nodorum (strain SN15 / ATCC MYA-4574 / FGSC 10173) TaxID=321614 RepID=Q0V2B1_PHANO|nr:hypothetical protein SNOG_01853 [Parastagonospora nodorum SN15]EAT90065.1 hypothetical protein SNOG_01853 [Parastagonospora nodorum SN15]